MYIAGQLCRKCRDEIGKENYVLICDKITRGLHTFHTRCAPKDPDVRRHHGMMAERGIFGAEGSPIGGI